MHSVYDLCSCNSGKKYKFCCLKKIQSKSVDDIAKNVSEYPIHLCLIGEEWEEVGLTTIMVSRSLPNGNFILGIYLLDVWCLGIKNADLKMHVTNVQLLNMIEHCNKSQKLVSMPYEDVRSLIFGGIEYAENLGFSPHKDWFKAQCVVEPDRPFTDKFEFGKDGEPIYIFGPNDDMLEIAETLNNQYFLEST